MHAIFLLLTCILAIAGVQMGYLIADAKQAQRENDAANSGPAIIRKHAKVQTYLQPLKKAGHDSKNRTQNYRYILESHSDDVKRHGSDAIHLTSKRGQINIPNKDLKNSVTELKKEIKDQEVKQRGDDHGEYKNNKGEMISIYLPQNKTKSHSVLQMLHLEFERHKEMIDKKGLKDELDVVDIDKFETENYIDRLDKKSSKLPQKTKTGKLEEPFKKNPNEEKITKNGDKHSKRKIFWGGAHQKYHSNERKKHSHEECSVNKTCSDGKCCVERRHSEWVCVDKGTKSVDQKCLDTCMCRGGFACFSFINSHKETSSSNTNKNSGQCVSTSQMKNHNGYVLDQSKNRKIRSKLLNISKKSRSL